MNASVQLQIFEYTSLPAACRDRAQQDAALIQGCMKTGRMAALNAGKLLLEMRQQTWTTDARLFESWLEVCVGIDPATASNLIALYKRLGHVEGIEDLRITDAAFKQLATADQRIVDRALSVAESGHQVNVRTLQSWRAHPNQESLLLAIGDSVSTPTISGTVIDGDRSSGTVTIASDEGIQRIPISDLITQPPAPVRADVRATAVPQSVGYSESILLGRLEQLEALLGRAIGYTRQVIPQISGVYRATGIELLEDLEEWISAGVTR